MTHEAVDLGTAASRPANPGDDDLRTLPSVSWYCLGFAVVLVVACRVTGSLLTEAGVQLHLGDGWPLYALWSPSDSHFGLLLPIGLAGLALWYGPRLAEVLPWRWLLMLAYLAAVAWAVGLALSEGVTGLTRPLATPYDYLHDVPRVTDLGGLLTSFTDHIVDPPKWTTHVSGHPPAALGFFVLLHRIGLGGELSSALACVVVGAVAVPAVLSTVRILGGEALARRAAPFLVFAPTALWLAVSADAVFAGVSAAGICALAHAARRTDRIGDVLAGLGGLALGLTLYLSYGLTLLGPLAIAVVLARRRIRPLMVGGLAVTGIVVAFTAAGFAWWEGLALAVERVHAGPAWQHRPQGYFRFANFAALAIAVGPATVAGLPLALKQRWSGFWVLPTGVLSAILAAGVSGLTTGEVERIYLPFAVWLLPVAGLLPSRTARPWLAAQLVVALILESLLRLGW